MTGFYPQGIALHEKLQRLAIKAGQCPLTLLAALVALILVTLYTEAVYLLVIWLAG
jgi:hypothetical protein